MPRRTSLQAIFHRRTVDVVGADVRRFYFQGTPSPAMKEIDCRSNGAMATARFSPSNSAAH